ncbi:hypothetical protein EMA8858_03751 [Emticicia aquatica]|uniref:Carboxypeptidase-like regulatory domain-containing protein n=1 Tax=Emticicia aquatica TaxID=1681835 RepID=A0ABM9AVL0_9BACT|nr:DUF5686 and carboxypeptidase regulatory-like domain-containing protein [Emticicia aquatica]CAH0997617.1 hypothetical protein EMA8858_03751 [Emticicia aquatica]
MFKKLLFLLFISQNLLAIGKVSLGGIKGIIKNEKGEVMPFASVLVKGTDIGTMANEEGAYEVKLKSGQYEVFFQYVGYQAVIKKVDVGETLQVINILMKEISIELGGVKVSNNKEDPALTIMRKIIGMSPIHHKEVESYSLRNYVRGSFKIDDVPFLFEKMLKENFLKKGQVYVMESVNEIKFKQPNTLSEKVISVRSNIPPTLKGAEGISFSRINFYNPNNNESPITAKGAIHYKYIYEGFFQDKGLYINKIRLIPKVKSPGLYNGTINIIDGTWSLHSVDLNWQEEVGNIKMKVIFSPIDDIWMPVQADVLSKIDAFGVEGSARIVTSFKNYQLVKNPKYATIKPQVLDDKIFKSEAKDLNRQKLNTKTIAEQKEITLKQLKQLSKNLEKEDVKDKKEKKEEIISSNFSRSEDSMARKHTEEFWLVERQVPLTEIETKGYKQADSIYVVEAKKINIKLKEDSIGRSRPAKFKVNHLITGHSYSYKPIDLKDKSKGYRDNFSVGGWLEDTRYNAVEGVNIGFPKLMYRRKIDSLSLFSFSVKPHYSVQRERLNGSISVDYNQKFFGLGVEGGRKVLQINNEEPFRNSVNSFFALFDNSNFGKFYEQRYLKLNFSPRIDEYFTLTTSLQLAERYHLINILNQGLWKKNERFYQPNDPIHSDFNTTAFETHTQMQFHGMLTYRPFSRVRIYNGNRWVQNFGPTFKLENTSAFGNQGFNRVELGVNHQFKWKLQTISLRTEMGTFYGNKPTYFLDYKHFNGNETFIQTHQDFRDLPFYKYSTAGSYAQFFSKVNFKRLLLTNIPYLQRKGWEERVYFNALVTNQLKHYEFGYGISGLFGLLNAEVYNVFNQNKYSHTGFRIYLPLKSVFGF